MVKVVPQNTEQKLTITCNKLVFFSQKKKDRVFDRFASHNLEPVNRDSLIFKIELTDKNSMKEQHLHYNQLLSKGNGNVQVKDDNRSNDRINFQRKSAENERVDKKYSDRDGAKRRKRPQFLQSFIQAAELRRGIFFQIFLTLVLKAMTLLTIILLSILLFC